MVEEQGLQPDALDQARSRGRHLGNGSRPRTASRRRVMQVTSIAALNSCRLTWPCDSSERRLRLEIFGIDEPLDDDLGLRRHQQIHRLGPHDIERRADQGAGDIELVEPLRNLLHRGEGDAGRRPQHDRGRQLLEAARPQLLPMIIDAGTQLERRVHAEPPARLHLAPVVAHVLDAGVRILGDVLRPGRIGRDVPAGRRDRERDAVEALSGLVEGLAGNRAIS